MTALSAGPAVVLLRPGDPVPAVEAGGKAASLDRLEQLGFRMPPTAVVTATTYRAVASDPGIVELLDRMAGGADVPAEEVDAAFLAAPIPDTVAGAIVDAARRVGGGGPVAVRSSATVEDLAVASFAGQYRSSLDVVGDDAVLRAVRLTWASLWHPAPRAYRRSWGIGGDGIAMAVVLMRMVPARTAGVAFTVDPGGRADTVRVEAVPELGEALVSGARTPDVWLVPRDRRGEPAGVPAAVPAEVLRAAELALRVEGACGGVPQDVEWAWDGERLWLLQARPITIAAGERGDECDTPVDASELTTSGIGEMLPGVLAPLVWDVNSFLVEEAFREVLGVLRALPAGRGRQHEFVRRVHGRAALDLDLIRAAARLLPGGSEAEIERQYFGAAGADAAEGQPAGRWRSLRQGLLAAAARRQGTVEAEVVLAATDEIVAARPPLVPRGDGDLLAYRRRLIALGARAMAVELAVAASAAAAYRQLEAFLTPHLGDREAASATQRVTTGAGTPRWAVPSMSRSIFAGPSWAETDGAELPVRRSARGQRAQAGEELENRLRSNPRWRRTRILTGQVVDVRLHVLRRLVSDTTDGLARRERVKSAVLQLGGEVRRVHLEFGRRLAALGAIDDARDVDLLRDAELAAALAGAGPPPAELSRRRRWLRRWQDEAPLPVRFVGSPDPEPAAAPVGDRLTGWAASPGRHTGRARVVTDPVHARFDADEVLVAAATDAGWSPLFLRAGAIVVERGGPLSHAAIVARELGVPAVLNLAGATEVLDGRLVTVDGDDGTVVVHAELDAQP